VKEDKIDNTIIFNIHSLVKILAIDLDKNISLNLEKHLRIFLVNYDVKVSEENGFDIILSKLRNIEKFTLEYSPKEFTPFWIKKSEDGISLVFGYRSKPDIVITLSNPIKLFYTPRTNIFNKLFESLICCIQLVVSMKGGILFHGAVMSSGNKDNCILVIGPSDIGKSIIVLNMLNEGWDYLSEDLFILYRNRAYIFRPYLHLLDYHFQNFPWLCDNKFLYKKAKRFSGFRRWSRKYVERYIPNFLIQRLRGLYSPSFFADLKALSLTSKIIYTAEPKISIVLMPGFEFGFTSVEMEDIIQNIKTIQWLAFPEFERVVRLLSLYGYSDKEKINCLIENYLEKFKFYKMTVPYGVDPNLLYQNFKKCIERVL
jgi:hypothetical protein